MALHSLRATVRASVLLALATAGLGLIQPSPLRAARTRLYRGHILASSTDPEHHEASTTTRRGVLTSAAAAAAATVALGGSGVRASAAAPIEAADALGAAGIVASGPPTTTLSLAAGLAGDSFVFPKMGLGAWAWGDALFWGYRPSEDEELRKTFDFAVDKGVTFFDTAELYGLGRSESLIGQFRRQDKPIQVATKFAALPWCTSRNDVVSACRKSVARLGEPIDLYQVHFPNAWSNEAYWEGLADCVDLGLVKNVGVSNYGSEAVRAASAALAKRGVKLASNQIQLSLLYRCALDNGLKSTCDELGVKILAYSPLGLGLLTGKYDADHLPSGPRAKLGKELYARPEYPAALSTIQAISKAHGDVPLTQVCLNWCIAKGTVPIPGARSIKQAEQNIGALAWSLTNEEVKALDDVTSKLPPLVPPETSPFPKQSIDTKLVMFDS